MRIWIAMLVAGCGRFGFDPGDARVALIDVNVDAPPCTFGAWSAANNLTTLSSAHGDFGSEVTPDGLALYWQANGDLWASHRATRTAPWDAPTMQTGLRVNGAAITDADIRAGELEIYFSDVNSCMYHSARSSPSATWQTATLVIACDANKTVGPHISLDGLALYYSDITGQNALGTILMRQRPTTADAFGAAAELPGIISDGLKGWPFVTADSLALYFEGGYMGDASTHRMFSATRTDPSQPFGTPSLIAGLDSPANGNEEDISLTADQLEIFFSTEATGGAGGFDLYTATRSCN